MDTEVAVSVVCNTYNHERFIRDALDGFLMQKTTFTFEVLIHDDASTDGTADIIREYERKRPDLIKPIYQTENQYSKHDGTIRRIQAGRARGKYVAFCEGDDYWIDPDKLQKQYDFMEAHPEYTMCTCRTKWLNVPTGKVTLCPKTDKDCDVTAEEIIMEKNGRPFQTASFFVRTEIWKNRPMWMNQFPVGDFPMALNAVIHGKVRLLADIMCVYRHQASGSWTREVAQNRAKRVEFFRKMVASLNGFDEATGGEYRQSVAERMRRCRYEIALMEGDFQAMRSADLLPEFKRRNIKQRIRDVVYCKMPDLYNLIRRVRTKNDVTP